MFDKFLCKKIQKKEIYLEDVLAYFGGIAFDVLVKCVFVLSPFVTIFIIHEMLINAPWTNGELAFPGALLCIITIVGSVVDLLFIIVYVVEKLNTIKVAECPLKKGENNEKQ